MVARVAFILLIMSCMHIPWCLEQPATSLLEMHPAFQHVARTYSVFRAALAYLLLVCRLLRRMCGWGRMARTRLSLHGSTATAATCWKAGCLIMFYVATVSRLAAEA